MLLVGDIPGLHEPSLHLNSFLEPIVDDLLKLWKDVEMVTTEGTQIVQAALLCNSSDVPATRKVGRFIRHGALKGCSRCLKSASFTRNQTIVALIHPYGLRGQLRNTNGREWNGN